MRLAFSFGILALFAVTVVAADEPKKVGGTKPGQVLPGPYNAFVVFGGPAFVPSDLFPKDKVQTDERKNFGDATRVGKFHDLITRFGLDPVVAVFSRDPIPAEDQPLAKLLQSLDTAVQKRKADRLHAFAVFLALNSDFLRDDRRPKLVKDIEEFATKANIKEVPLALDRIESDRTTAFNLDPDNSITVVLYVNLTVKAKFNFTAEKPLDEAGIKKIMAELDKLLKR